MLDFADMAKTEGCSMEGTALRVPRMGLANKPVKLHLQASPMLPSFLLYVSSLTHKQDLRALPDSPVQSSHRPGLAPSCVLSWISYNCNILELPREADLWKGAVPDMDQGTMSLLLLGEMGLIGV